MHFDCELDGQKFIVRADGRPAVKMLHPGGLKGAGAQTVGKVGPDTECSTCHRTMDEGEVAVYTALEARLS